jgi:hypothetical protein
MVRLSAVLALAGLSSACNMSASCDAAIYPAITLAVLDASSGLRLAGASASATRWTSHFTFVGESATADLELHGPSGTYTVVVRRAGNQDWVRTGVTVRNSGGSCPGPVTESLEATLVAAPD